MLVWEELDYINIDDIGNVVFIDEECRNPIIVHINQKKKSDFFQSLIGVHLSKNVVGESGILEYLL